MRTQAEIQSPGFPGGYLGPHDCTLTILVPEASWIGFYIMNFTMKRPTNRNCDDSVTIRNQDKPQNYAQLCGNVTSQELIFHDSSSYRIEKIDVHFNAISFLERERTHDQLFLFGYIGKYDSNFF